MHICPRPRAGHGPGRATVSTLAPDAVVAARPATSPAGRQAALASLSCPANAARRALAFAKAPPGVNPGAEVTASARSAFATARGGEIRFRCGPTAALRAVVAQLLFPWLLPRQSPSQQVMFADRFHRGNRAWYAL